jgi:hypothetical protein
MCHPECMFKGIVDNLTTYHLQQVIAKIMQTSIKNSHLSKLNLNYLVQENYFI